MNNTEKKGFGEFNPNLCVNRKMMVAAFAFTAYRLLQMGTPPAAGMNYILKTMGVNKLYQTPEEAINDDDFMSFIATEQSKPKGVTGNG